jgi:hypothetical protein
MQHARFYDGFNATVLAYGQVWPKGGDGSAWPMFPSFRSMTRLAFVVAQTGSGKTFTMGSGLDTVGDADLEGMIPRAVRYLFGLVDAAGDGCLPQGDADGRAPRIGATEHMIRHGAVPPPPPPPL